MFLMMRTLRDMNMSKFVAEDVPLFISLIEDLFPAQKADRAQFPEISAALEKVRRDNTECFLGCTLGHLQNTQIHEVEAIITFAFQCLQPVWSS